MSNTIADVYTGSTDDPAAHGREARVYDAMHAMISPRNEVLRFLPHKERRMVGAWCFVDLFGPSDVHDQAGMSVPPHPHMGLQTVSWLVQGTVLHRDSIGTTALVEPGRVAVMNAGNGIAHSENSPADHGPVLHGAQLWVALPESARHGEHSFVLHEDAPIRDSPGLRARVFVGRVGTTVAPAQGITPLVGADLSPESPQSRAGSVPLDPSYEHLLVPMVGGVRVAGADVRAGQGIYLGTDRPSGSRAVRRRSGIAPGRPTLRGGGRHVVELRCPLARGDRAGEAAVEHRQRPTVRRGVALPGSGADDGARPAQRAAALPRTPTLSCAELGRIGRAGRTGRGAAQAGSGASEPSKPA